MTNILLSKLGRFANKKVQLTADQDTGDIMTAILNAHGKYKSEYDKISSLFIRDTPKQTARAVWSYLKNNIHYKPESESNQRILSPQAILSIKKNLDCKSMALFANGILDSINRSGRQRLPVTYRFSSYNLFDQTPQHVFSVVNPGKDEIWVDPVLQNFDEKKPYQYKKDKMALYSISGVKKPNIVLKVAAAVPRNAFLLLVKINFTGLATKLKASWEKAPSKLQNFWGGIGGNINSLKIAFDQGAKKKRIFGIGAFTIGDPATAAAAASAAPILIKVASFFKSIGIGADEIKAVGEKLKQTLINKIDKKQDQIIQAQEYTDRRIANEVASEAGLQKNYLPLLLVGGAALYFLTKKR